MNRANEERLVLDRQEPEPKTPIFIYVVAVLSAIGGLLFGYDTGVVSGAMLLMADYFHLNDWMQGVVVSVTIIAAWLSCLLAASLTDKYGRKIVIIAASVVFTLGSVLMGVAHNKELLIVGRVVVGIGIGIPCYWLDLFSPIAFQQLYFLFYFHWLQMLIRCLVLKQVKIVRNFASRS